MYIHVYSINPYISCHKQNRMAALEGRSALLFLLAEFFLSTASANHCENHVCSLYSRHPNPQMCLLCVCCLLRFVVSFVLQATTFHSCRHASLPYLYSYGHCVVVRLLSLILNAASLISHRLLDFLHFSPLLILDEADTITFSVAKLVQAALYQVPVPYYLNYFKNFFPSVASQQKLFSCQGEIIR